MGAGGRREEQREVGGAGGSGGARRIREERVDQGDQGENAGAEEQRGAGEQGDSFMRSLPSYTKNPRYVPEV